MIFFLYKIIYVFWYRLVSAHLFNLILVKSHWVYDVQQLKLNCLIHIKKHSIIYRNKSIVLAE